MNKTPVITLDLVITQSDIDDIICTAFEGGVNYWCCKADQIGENVTLNKGDEGIENTWYADEAGRFEYVLFDAENGKRFEGAYSGMYMDKITKGRYRNLTLSAMREGLELYVDEARDGGHGIVLPGDSSFDAGSADYIIQLAVFGSVVFG